MSSGTVVLNATRQCRDEAKSHPRPANRPNRHLLEVTADQRLVIPESLIDFAFANDKFLEAFKLCDVKLCAAQHIHHFQFGLPSSRLFKSVHGQPFVKQSEINLQSARCKLTISTKCDQERAAQPSARPPLWSIECRSNSQWSALPEIPNITDLGQRRNKPILAEATGNSGPRRPAEQQNPSLCHLASA